MRTHFLKVKRLCRCPFLQNSNTYNHFLKIQELQALVTIFRTISSQRRNAIAFLQNDHKNMKNLFLVLVTTFLTVSSHGRNAIAFLQNDHKNMTNLFQVLVTTFLTVSSHSRNAIAFLQNDQLFNNHRTLDHQGRGVRSPSFHLKKPRRSPTMSPMSRWKALRSTSRTSERGLTRC